MKIVVIGTSGSGKSALISRLVKGEFSETQIQKTSSQCVQGFFDTSTLGRIPLYFWDIGTEPSTMSMYLKNADVVLCTFSLSDPKSLDRLETGVFYQTNLLALIQSYKINFSLIGTHADTHRYINQVEIENFCGLYEIQNCHSVSAKSGVGIPVLDDYLKQCVVRLLENKTIQRQHLKEAHLITCAGKQASVLAMAQEECHYLWDDDRDNIANIRHVLDDYALDNKGPALFYHLHANRHHTYQVSLIVKRIDNQLLTTADGILEAVNKIQNISEAGSLFRRLAFIKHKLRGEDAQVLIGKPPLF